jgi:hypothetical protein
MMDYCIDGKILNLLHAEYINIFSPTDFKVIVILKSYCVMWQCKANPIYSTTSANL